MSEVKRKKGESFEAFMRRFRRRMQMSGKQLQTKRVQFREHQKSKTLKRQSALLRLKRASEREYLLKVGKLKEEPQKGGR